VVVIDVLGLAGPTNGAHAVLLKDQPFDRNGVEVVAAPKMELPSVAVMLLSVLSRDAVVTRLAVISIT
jgi:hypothetical protein